jgi:hypothetical protein
LNSALHCEFIRNNIEDPFQKNLAIIYTMKKKLQTFVNFLQSIANTNSDTLKRLHYKLLKKYFNNTKQGIRATYAYFWKLVDLKVIRSKVNTDHKEKGTPELIFY